MLQFIKQFITDLTEHIYTEYIHVVTLKLAFIHFTKITSDSKSYTQRNQRLTVNSSIVATLKTPQKTASRGRKCLHILYREYINTRTLIENAPGNHRLTTGRSPALLAL